MAQNLGLKVEEIEDSAPALVDTLTTPGSSKMALPFDEAISKPVKSLWQTLTSLQPTAKRVERKYFVPPKGYEYWSLIPSPQGSLVVATANEWERQ